MTKSLVSDTLNLYWLPIAMEVDAFTKMIKRDSGLNLSPDLIRDKHSYYATLLVQHKRGWRIIPSQILHKLEWVAPRLAELCDAMYHDADVEYEHCCLCF